MIRNYFLIAFRSLKKNKVYSFINIIGLSFGIACSLLILLWVQYETGFNGFHEKKERIYRVMENQFYANGYILTTPSTPGPLSGALATDIPEVEKSTQLNWGGSSLFTYGEKSFKESGNYAGKDFFQVFTFPLISGDPKTALAQPNSIAISEKMAKKYFNSTDVIGKTFIVNQKDSYKITAVFKDAPENSSLKFEYLMPIADYINKEAWTKDWGSNWVRTFVLLKEGADEEKVGKKLTHFIKKHQEKDYPHLHMQKVSEMYLNGRFENGKLAGGRIEFVRLFMIIGGFILVIACINFMNLSTARAGKRAKEVGVRKVVGASKIHLVRQFLGESLLLAIIATLFGLMFMHLLIPVFKNILGHSLTADYTDPKFVLIILGITLITGVLAGSYPALFLSSFQPVSVLKSGIKFSAFSAYLRQGLVVFQFCLSLILIIGTIVVYTQIQYIQNKNMGYERENVLTFPGEGKIAENFDGFTNDLKSNPNIISVSASNQHPLYIGNSTGGVTWPGKDEKTQVLFSVQGVNMDYLKTMKMKLKEGRDFSKQFSTDTATVLLNEKSAKAMGLKNPVGTKIKFWDKEWTVIGVVENFHFYSLHYEIEPIIMTVDPKQTSNYLVKINGQNTKETMAAIETAYKKFNPDYPFEATFLNEDFDKIYKSETIRGKLATYFAVVAIFISCLGLFGLSTFTAEQKTREIGIRKVLGASVSSIVTLLNKDFLKLVAVAFVIAAPLSWYLMDKWLQNFVYHINIGWYVFLIAAVAGFGIALITLSFQSIKASLENPVKSLRTE